MATDSRQRTTWGSRFRFLTRALGLTGLLVVVVGAIMLYADLVPAARDFGGARAAGNQARAGGASVYLAAAVLLILGGLAAIAVALAVEALNLLLSATGRSTVANTTTMVGVVAALALLVLVNVYSFTHTGRIDCTRDQRFTLPPEIAGEMSKLRGNAPTTIVVLRMHNFGSLSPRRDSYTAAAEEKVTEKVKDLVDRFREFGPRFNVVVLDSEAFEYEEELKKLTKDAPELKSAIAAAPENSIFFHANKRVQRLSFNEFMQLDKTASKEADGGRANLVLLPQGIDTFARRVLTVQERRPKVAVCVTHEWLSTAVTDGTKPYTLAGMKKALTDHGFDVVDVLLKKNWEDNTKELEPAAYTFAESKLERLEAEADSARDAVQSAKDDVKLLAAVAKEAADETARTTIRERVEFYNALRRGAQLREWTELFAAFVRWGGRGQPVTAENEGELKALVTAGLAAQAKRAEEQVKEAEVELLDAEAKVKEAEADERAVEDRRIADVQAKLTRLVADVDLLIVPRHTLVTVSPRTGVPPSIHQLDKKQVEVMRGFMLAGKPVLACVGSAATPGAPGAPDGFEQLLADRGIELGRETVLYDAERKSLAAARTGGQIAGGGTADIPPLVFTAEPPAGSKVGPNPIANALRLSGRTVEQKLDIKLFAPRPVYLAHSLDGKTTFAAEFVSTAPAGWNEERPLTTADQSGRITYMPRYDPTPKDDPKRGTRAEERRASFPVGVAVESKLPVAVTYEDYEQRQIAAALNPFDNGAALALARTAELKERPMQRTVVFGSGHLFSGSQLDPPQEKLLLYSVNWLTAREDRLPKAEQPAWQYPRVAMDEREKTLWRVGAAVGLPLVAAYMGLLAMMRRRMR